MRRMTLAAMAVGLLALGACTSTANEASKPTTLAVNGGSSTTSLAGGATLPDGATTSSVPGGTPTVPPTDAPTTSTTVAPTSSAPAGVTVTISRGGFINKTTTNSCTPTTCKYVQIDSSGWTKGQLLSVTCHSASGTSGPYAKNADSSGNFSAGTVCYFGNATNVYVDINGVASNVITPWKDW